MTGDVNIDAVLTIVAALAIFLGGAFGWPWLVKLGQRLRGEEPTLPPAPVDPTAPLPVSEPAALARVRAAPAWLLMLLPLLQPLLQAIIEALRKRLGREPTQEEIQREASSRLYVLGDADEVDTV